MAEIRVTVETISEQQRKELKEVIEKRAEIDGRPKEAAALLRLAADKIKRIYTDERKLCGFCEEATGSELQEAEAAVREVLALLESR